MYNICFSVALNIFLCYFIMFSVIDTTPHIVRWYEKEIIIDRVINVGDHATH